MKEFNINDYSYVSFLEWKENSMLTLESFDKELVNKIILLSSIIVNKLCNNEIGITDDLMEKPGKKISLVKKATIEVADYLLDKGQEYIEKFHLDDLLSNKDANIEVSQLDFITPGINNLLKNINKLDNNLKVSLDDVNDLSALQMIYNWTEVDTSDFSGSSTYQIRNFNSNNYIYRIYASSINGYLSSVITYQNFNSTLYSSYFSVGNNSTQFKISPLGLVTSYYNGTQTSMYDIYVEYISVNSNTSQDSYNNSDGYIDVDNNNKLINASSQLTSTIDSKADQNALDSTNSNVSANANKIGQLSLLTTIDKSNTVNAINEVNNGLLVANNNISSLNSNITANTTRIGSLSSLSTIDKSSVVNAVNEVNDNLTATTNTGMMNSAKITTNATNIGQLAQLITNDKSSAVGAINEVSNNVSAANTSINTNRTNIIQNTNSIGTLNNLATIDKTNLVNAVNEVDSNMDGLNTNIMSNTSSIGNLTTLSTAEKSNLVGAINEVNDNVTLNYTKIAANKATIGNLGDLITNDKSNTVTAINEVKTNANTNSYSISVNTSNIITNKNNLGHLSDLITNDNSSAVAAINEVSSNVSQANTNILSNTNKIGQLGNLSTADKSTIVNAINEVNSATNGKQTVLISGTNIKTVNNSTILGNGNLIIDKSSVGLANVDNTADTDKPISSSTQTALNLKADKTQLNNYVLSNLIGNPNGVAPLNNNGYVDPSYLDPALTGALHYMGAFDASTITPVPQAVVGNMYIVSAAGSWNGLVLLVGDQIIYDGSMWAVIQGGDRVQSVNGETGQITITKAKVGLGNVDNTSDVNKPVSAATQTVLDAKANQTDLTMTNNNIGILSALTTTDKSSVVNAVNEVNTSVGNKQTTLISGTNIKTVNNATILGSGNLAIDKTSVGLGNVDNTSDVNKPVSSATQTVLNMKASQTDLNTTNTNIGSLSTLSTMDKTSVVNAVNEVNASVGSKQATLVSGTNIKTINSNNILGNGDIVIDKTAVGLGNVDNTSDINKNVLSATKLTNARNINGVTFDGTSDITLTAKTTNALTIGTGLNLSSGTTFDGSSASTLNLSNVGTAGTYGSSTSIPVFTTNAQGQITAVTNTPALKTLTDYYIQKAQAVGASNTTFSTIGTVFTNSGTATAVAMADTAYGRVRKLEFLSAAAAGSLAGVIGLANVSVNTGFEFTAVFSYFAGTIANNRLFVGLKAAALTNAALTAQANAIGIGFDTTATVYSTYAGGATLTATATTSTIGAVATSNMKLQLSCPAAGTSASYTLTNLTAGTSVTGTIAIGTLAGATFLAPIVQGITSNASSVGITFSEISLTTLI